MSFYTHGPYIHDTWCAASYQKSWWKQSKISTITFHGVNITCAPYQNKKRRRKKNPKTKTTTGSLAHRVIVIFWCDVSFI